METPIQGCRKRNDLPDGRFYYCRRPTGHDGGCRPPRPREVWRKPKPVVRALRCVAWMLVGAAFNLAALNWFPSIGRDLIDWEKTTPLGTASTVLFAVFILWLTYLRPAMRRTPE